MPEEYQKVATEFREANTIKVPDELYRLIDKNIRYSFNGSESVFVIGKDELRKFNFNDSKIDKLLIIIVDKYAEFGWTMLAANNLDTPYNALGFRCSEQMIDYKR